MVYLFLLLGVLVAGGIITGLLLKFKKFKEEFDNELLTIKLLINNVKEEIVTVSRQSLDLIHLNKLDVDALKTLTDELKGMVQANEQKIQEFSKAMEEHFAHINEFKENIRSEFVEYQDIINPQFHQTNKSAADIAAVLKHQLEITIGELIPQVAHAKEELAKIKAFHLLRTKDVKEHQVHDAAAKVDELEKRLNHHKQHLDNLNSITDTASKSLSEASMQDSEINS